MDWKNLKNNPDSWLLIKKRARIVDSIRSFFKKESFLEVQTPLLSPSLIPESYLEIFATKLANKTGKRTAAFLTPSPELWHKKLLAAGSGNIFEITKSFRNTDIGGHFHNPEFTILEWYRVNANYKDTMKDCENLVRFINRDNPKITYQGKSLNVDRPFERLSMIEAFKKYAGIKPDIFFDKKKLFDFAQSKGYQVRQDDDWETVFNLIYVKDIEPQLGLEKPTIIYDFPAQFAPLAKTSRKDPRIKERFELYLFGIELADAYNELIDPAEQALQFKKETSLRKKLRKTDHPVDRDFLKALSSGLPLCSGVALGVDRLVMILTDQTDINKVILFSGADIFPESC